MPLIHSFIFRCVLVLTSLKAEHSHEGLLFLVVDNAAIPRPPHYWRIKKDQPLNENLKIFQFLKKCMFHKFQTFRVITSFTLVFFTFVFFMRTLTYFPIAQPLKIVSFHQNHLLPSFFHHKKRKKIVFLFYFKVNVFWWRHQDKILH